MKKVYFVRHGESEGNIGPIRQTASAPLTENGRRQAAFVAERCKKLPVELIVSSTMSRAKETSQIILEKINKPIQYSDLFVERRRSSEVLGKPKDNPVALEIDKTIKDNFHREEFRFSDEENFTDLKERAKQSLAYLASRPEESILVVTHGLFMRMVVAYAVFRDDLTGMEGKGFVRSFHTENTGITVLGYDEKDPKFPWFLWVWNDHAHLG